MFSALWAYLGGVIPVKLELDVAQACLEHDRVHVGRVLQASESRNWRLAAKSKATKNGILAPDS